METADSDHRRPRRERYPRPTKGRCGGTRGSVVGIVSSACVPGPEAALSEAHRVLRPGGGLVVLDGDYATPTVALANQDPLQACADAAVAGLVNDRWLVRRLPRMVSATGFRLDRLESHGYMQTSSPDYMLTLVDRGADLLVATAGIDADLAKGLKREARKRADEGRFFGFIAFAGIIASKSG